ncbi:cupredoxin domain-containing protein [Natrononativus amylolyticus]|uniref:cupredoxin domain-containing protein n=1 Tax=Natrononativus amylolyticus TaxID=2963434 RepID=UPI0020CD745C|nr:plastocyanin/azurin family copper-binding protein [Natrononativus amylolyticus]
MNERRKTRRRLLVASGTLLTTGLAGCIGEDPGADDPYLGDPEPYVEVRLEGPGTDASVDPPVVHLVDGGTVEWVADGETHDATAYHPDTHGDQQRIPDGADPWESGPLSSEDSFDLVLDVEGVYDYVCTRHEGDGMVGSIVVGWPDPNEALALEPPDDDRPEAAIAALEERNERVRSMLEEEHDDSVTLP